MIFQKIEKLNLFLYYYSFAMAQTQENPKIRQRLLPKDLALWGIEAIGVAGGIYAVAHLGLPQIYTDIGSQIGPTLDILLNNPSLLKNSEFFKPVATGLGFLTGFTTTTIAMPEVLIKLRGKIRLNGTGKFKSKDGGRMRDKQCVDGRIAENLQESVEPGAGIMGGGFVRDNLTALLLHNVSIEHPFKDFAIGYLLGRSTPTAIITGLNTQLTALKTLSEKSVKGFLKENHLPHDLGCGWSATNSFLKHHLKFSKANHEEKIKILDALNRIDAFLNTLIWEPMMNTIATPLSGFSFMINPNFGTTSIHEKIEDK